MKQLKLNIKTKLVLLVSVSMISISMLAIVVSYFGAYESLKNVAIKRELPMTAQFATAKLGKELSVLFLAAKKLANDKYVADNYKQNRMKSMDVLTRYLLAVREEHNLLDASIADRKTGRYWNQNGFNRVFDRNSDPIFYRLVDSGKEYTFNLFTDENNIQKFFVNYQDRNGTFMSGLSKTTKEWNRFLTELSNENTGKVYLVDQKGIIQINGSSEKLNGKPLSDLFHNTYIEELLLPGKVNTIEATGENGTVFLASSPIKSIGWYIVVEQQDNTILFQLNQLTQKISVWVLALLIIFSITSVYLVNKFFRPVNKVSQLFKELSSRESDLKSEIKVSGNDEMTSLAVGFNTFIGKISHSLCQVKEVENQLRNSSESILNQSRLSLTNSQNQTENIGEVSCAISQMNSSIQEISESASGSAAAAKQIIQITKTSEGNVTEAHKAIDMLSDNIMDVSGVVVSLAEKSQTIVSVLEVIRGISEQTNLLALNAAIEAARAGEQGRGFAVVADEVRNLASRTANSTDEIQQMINSLQSDAKTAVAAAEQSKTLVSGGVRNMQIVSQDLSDISRQVTEITDITSQVATATEEQSVVVNNIEEIITEADNSSKKVNQLAGDLEISSQHLVSLSNDLKKMTDQFKL